MAVVRRILGEEASRLGDVFGMSTLIAFVL